ncbi:MAG: DUF4405 domain-containing protein [Alphaproteobacteria bacterium]|nr:DUF4405 domain-containing protein [Alphaproteobacteria bacterium]
MNPMFLLRLVMDCLAASLLLIGLAYWWLGNAAHELAGTGMFLLLVVHNLFNRRWYGTAARARREARGAVNLAATALLLVAMLVLLATSVLISETLSGGKPPLGGVAAQQVHALAAYWVLIFLSVHLGLRWPMLMSVAGKLAGIAEASALRTLALRAAAAAIAAHGVVSLFALGIGTKLAMQVTLDLWDFEASAAGFFRHCVAVAGLGIVLTHYAMAWVRRRPRGLPSAAAVAQELRHEGQGGR